MIDPTTCDEYFKAYADEPRRRGQLDLYRCGDFEKLEPYDGQACRPGRAVPGPVGRERPVRAGRRRAAAGARDPGASVQVIPGSGHFPFEDAPETAAPALATFLVEAAPR